MHAVKFGLFLPTGDFAQARAAAEWADANRFYSVSINDHFFSPLGSPRTPQLECFATLSAIASVTRHVRLAPAVSAVSFRNPAMLAKIASTLDHLSGGRLILGIGAGWQRNEYDAHGYPYPDNLERIAQLDEAIDVIKAMWTEDEPTLHGKYFTIAKAYNYPRPVQQPHPPIMVGGSGVPILKLVAKKAQMVNLIPPIVNGKDFVQDPSAAVKFTKRVLGEKIARLRDFTQAAGRAADAVELGVMTMVHLSRNQAEADAALAQTAQRMGFADNIAARNSPVLLIGTPAEVRQELRERIEAFGTTYYIVFPTSPESGRLLVEEIMPEFASPAAGSR
ncbi:MAG TPA: LLM class flavin-dependent oxidoreductase [Candidatus Binataceae bacterium]|nr:LLM class flavin-dependent oxidoreductase [Candidatus Binataceae bacterium]